MMPRNRVFISYRRDDSAYVATAIRDELERKIGKGYVFFDIDSISPGQDFIEKLETSLKNSDALLAIIGDNWNTVKDGEEPPLNSPDDFVRQELERAFEHQLQVIPVLVGKAAMPSKDELPTSLSRLPRCQALEVRAGSDFKHHLTRLTQKVKSIPQTKLETASNSRFVGKKLFLGIILTIVILFVSAYPICIHDRLKLNHAVRLTKTVNLRPAPGVNLMPGTIVISRGQIATYVARTFRKYRIKREESSYFDYWRKLRTEDGKDGWVYGAFVESASPSEP